MPLASELTPEEFYQATLANQGLLDDALSITKEAEVKIAALAQERGLPVEVVKLAEAYYQQLDLDGLEYDDPATQREDALKIAEAYYEHLTEVRTAAVDLADAAAQKLAEAATAFIKERELDLDVEDVLKMAQLQTETSQAYDEAALAQHQTAVEIHASVKTALAAYNMKVAGGELPEESKTAAPVFFGQPHESTVDLSGTVADILQSTRGADPALIPKGPRGIEAATLALAPSLPKEQRESFLRSLAVRAHQDPTKNYLEHAQALSAPAAAPQGWASRNKGALIAGGLLGAGALYYLKKKRDAEAAAHESEMNQLRARLLPPA